MSLKIPLLTTGFTRGCVSSFKNIPEIWTQSTASVTSTFDINLNKKDLVVTAAKTN